MMPKRRRLIITPKKSPRLIARKEIVDVQQPGPVVQKEMRHARGRLMGALLDALEVDESEDERYYMPRARRAAEDTEDEDRDRSSYSPPKNSYVLKLFDRSVDLSQFEEDSPLYPICKAWMLNQPKANYKKLGRKEDDITESTEGIRLPKPKGPPVSKIPSLLPEQLARSKDNINLNYKDAPLLSHEKLLSSHIDRWTSVRRAWLDQAAKFEERHKETQRVLNKCNFNSV